MQARDGIKHRLTRPYRPQTNGLVERFNRRLSETLRARPTNGKNTGLNRFISHKERNAFLNSLIYAYNRTQLQSLACTPPIEMLNNQQKQYTWARKRKFWN